MVKRTTDPKDPTNILPLKMPQPEEEYYTDVLGFLSLALAMGSMVSRQRVFGWGGLIIGILAMINQRNSQNSYRSSTQGITFSFMAIVLSFVNELMLHAAEREAALAK